MNRCFSLLAAATLTLTAACGDNIHKPVAVDDDSTSDFDRFTVNAENYAIADAFIAPDSIFSYANKYLDEQVEFLLGVDALGRFGDRFDGLDKVDLDDLEWDTNFLADRFGDREIDGYGEWAQASATEAQRCNSFSRAPGSNQAEGDRPDQLAPEGLEAETNTGTSLESIDEREMLGDQMGCREVSDNSNDIAGVCECADLDCVAGYVDAVMGCDVCMTFVCGDELLGACAACAP